MLDLEKKRAKILHDSAVRRRRTAYDRAVKRDSRLTKAETAARDKVRNYYRVRQWQERHHERLTYERTVRRDNRPTSEERAATRRIRKNEQFRQWALRNPERYMQHRKKATAMYYGRRRNAPGHASTDQVAARWAYYADRCWMCGEPATQNDHVIPLSRGGSNWPANLRPACGPCNREKWDRKPVVINAIAGVS